MAAVRGILRLVIGSPSSHFGLATDGLNERTTKHRQERISSVSLCQRIGSVVALTQRLKDAGLDAQLVGDAVLPAPVRKIEATAGSEPVYGDGDGRKRGVCFALQ